MSYKAFVSSTFIDLKDHREHVIKALEDAGFSVDPMERWTADSDEPKEVSVERMRDCELCILLVAARRGHIPEGEVLSITQMEVQAAEKRGIKVLAFLSDPECAWPPKHYELDKDDELRKWRDDLMEHKCVAAFTHDPASLDAPVRDALNRWIQKQSWPEVHKVYLETLRDTHASVRFLGIGKFRDIKDRSIEDLFVEPFLANHHISPDSPPDKWPETTPLFKAVSAKKNLVVLGDPGSGKSTLVSWLVWSLCSEGNNKVKQALGDVTPFVMILREMKLDEVRGWDSLLDAYFQHLTARMLGHKHYAGDIRRLLEKGKAMIVLDGLDEVGNVKIQENLRNTVWEGIERYEDCLWLLTSRLIGYLGYHEEEEEVGELGFRQKRTYASLRYVAPFSDCQVKQFARNWFTKRDRSAVRAEQDSKRFLKAVHSNPYTLRLARIPNLLTMMALIHRERAHLPHGRALLYTDIANAYLESIDENRRIERLGYSLRDQKQWLGRIGFEMQMQRHKSARKRSRREEQEILAEGSDVRKWVIQAMRGTGRKDSDEEAAEAFLDEVCRRSGLLLPRGEDRFAFTHLSFQEFFAAVFLLRQFMRPPRLARRDQVQGAAPEDLPAYAGVSNWQETLVFLVELVFAEHEEWLEDLLECLFGEEFEEVAPTVDRQDDASNNQKAGRGVLLARLAINPHAGLAELREKAIQACCDFEASRWTRLEKGFDYHPRVLAVLLSADSDELPCIWGAIHRAFDTEYFSLRGCPVQDLSRLSALRNLRWLSLMGANVSDVSPLAKLSGLNFLDLSSTQVSDVSPLAKLSRLTALYLRSTQVSDLSPLAKLSRLTALYLRSTQVSDVSPLAKLSGLRKLDLSSTQVSDVSPLASLSGLSNLYLFAAQVKDVSPLAKLTGLTDLDLSSTQVSDLSPLAKLSELTGLNVSSTQVSDLSPLAKLSELTGLDLSSTQVSDLSPLARLSGLKLLVLYDLQLSDESVKSLKDALPDCKVLR